MGWDTFSSKHKPQLETDKTSAKMPGLTGHAVLLPRKFSVQKILVNSQWINDPRMSFVISFFVIHIVVITHTVFFHV